LKRLKKGSIFGANRWVSKGGRVTLVKIMFKVIPIYWMALPCISTNILKYIGNCASGIFGQERGTMVAFFQLNGKPHKV
jgi:hypothetical protein